MDIVFLACCAALCAAAVGLVDGCGRPQEGRP